MCNLVMEREIHSDWKLIEDLGGPKAVVEILGWPKEGGVQRVQNWKYRGIPPEVKLERPDLFLPNFKPVRKVARA